MSKIIDLKNQNKVETKEYKTKDAVIGYAVKIIEKIKNGRRFENPAMEVGEESRSPALNIYRYGSLITDLQISHELISDKTKIITQDTSMLKKELLDIEAAMRAVQRMLAKSIIDFEREQECVEKLDWEEDY